MRKTGAVLVAVMVTAALCFGGDKQRLSVFASIGYGFGIGGLLIDSSVTASNGRITSAEGDYLNVGSGIKLDAGAALRIMQNVDALLAVEYTGGVPSITAEHNIMTPPLPQTAGDTTFVYKRHQTGIKAQIAPRFRAFDLLDMYVGVGAGWFFTSSSIDVRAVYAGTVFPPANATIEEENASSLAFLASVGVEYPISDFADLCGELGLEGMSTTKTKQTVMLGSTFPAGGKLAPQSIEFLQNSALLPPPSKIPGTNLAVKLGVKFWIL